MRGDARLKAFLLRQGFAIPTDSQLERFPSEFRDFNSLDKTVRFHAGVALLAWISREQHEVSQ